MSYPIWIVRLEDRSLCPARFDFLVEVHAPNPDAAEQAVVGKYGADWVAVGFRRKTGPQVEVVEDGRAVQRGTDTPYQRST